MEFIAFDLETTGFFAGVDQIIEIGAIRFVDAQPESMFCTLVNPGRLIPIEATRVNKITDEMVQGYPTIDQLLEPFAQFCGDTMMVAHNAPFDFQFLAADITKHETPAPRGLILDTCAMARKAFPGLLNYKLGTLVEHLKISAAGFHRAQADSGYCGTLFQHILDRVSVNGQPPAIESLMALSNNQVLKFPQLTKQPKQLDLLAALDL